MSTPEGSGPSPAHDIYHDMMSGYLQPKLEASPRRRGRERDKSPFYERLNKFHEVHALKIEMLKARQEHEVSKGPTIAC